MLAARNRIAGLVCLAAVLSSGCSRSRVEHRLDADREARCVIAEKNTDPRWQEPELRIETDPRSRFHDPHNPDCPPMPPDDPSSHRFMHCVNGRSGWKHWHDNGDIVELENPAWRASLPDSVEVTEEGKVRLTLETALKLAYLHSPEHQSQLETVYLSALDVTTERFRLDSQFTGGLDAVFTANGQKVNGGSSTFSVGRGAGAQPFPGGFGFGGGSQALQSSRRLATAGTIVTSVANSFVWEFSGGDTNFAGSILSAGFVQPLLRGAGRDIALEQLTIVERAMLANIRAYHQYRQGFYTDVAIGELGVAGPQRRGGFFGGTGLTGFTGQGAGGFGGVGTGEFGGGGGGTGTGGGSGGQGFAGGGAGTVGGFIGLLQQLQQLRNTEDSLSLQLRALSLLEAHLDAGVIDLIQVDQFRQSIETERAQLLQNRNGLLFALEGFTSGTLGLPPDLPVELDDSLVRQFQFVAPEASAVQADISALQDLIAARDNPAAAPEFANIQELSLQRLADVELRLAAAQKDVDQLKRGLPGRQSGMTGTEYRLLQHDCDQLDLASAELKQELQALRENRPEGGLPDVITWLSGLYRVAQGLILVQARARLEIVTVDPVRLESEDAFQIALENRIDLMNSRAALVDSWRLIAFNADALQANITIAAGGDLRTSGDNPVRFDARNATARAGVQIDAPFQRLLERNNYRQSLIDYQRSRRRFIQTQDGLKFGLRATLRHLDQLRQNLEIQRRAVAISIRRVDLTREELNRPVPPPLPGRPPAQFGPTAATSLLTALSDLRNTQNNFMSVWLNYYATRMRLCRDLGIMRLNEDGTWIDEPLPESTAGDVGRSEPDLPPEAPDEWMELAKFAPEKAESSDTSPQGGTCPGPLSCESEHSLPATATHSDEAGTSQD